MPKGRNATPHETSDQQSVVEALRRRHVLVFSVPNGARRTASERGRALREGLLAGGPTW